MGTLRHLRNQNLGEYAFCLAPFINAYRPHGDIPSRKELIALNGPVAESESCGDVVRQQFEHQREWVDL